MKKNIGIDVDGVLADTFSRWLHMAELKYGIVGLKKDLVRHELSEVFTKLSHDQVIDLWHEAWNDYSSIKLEDKDVPFIINDLRDKFDICITTGNPSAHIKLWLKEKGIHYDKYFTFPVPSEKHGVDGIDILIDDFHKVVKNAVLAGKTGILLRQPWNEDFINTNTTKGIIVADNWRSIKRILLDIA